MAISISSEPNTGELIATAIPNANDFEVQVTVATGELPPKIKTQILGYKIGTGTVIHSSAELEHEYRSKATNTYTFNINAAGRVQNFFDNFSIFPTLDTFTGGVSDAYGIDYRLEADSWRATASNDTYQQVATATSSAITSVNARRELTETQNMEAFDTASTIVDRRFFTNKPNNVQTDYESNEWLMVQDKNSSYIVLVTYMLADGSTFATREFYITGTTTGANNTGKIGQIGVGVKNIEAAGAGGKFLSGANIDFEASNIKSYSIEVRDGGGVYTTETRNYYITKCSPTYRIHFVNKLGGVDSLLVSRFKNSTFTTEGESYAVAKTSSNTAQESGLQVLQKTGKEGIAFKMEVTEAERIWLKDLAVSPAVRLEKDGAYISLYITKLDFSADDELGQTYTMDFEAEYSNREEGLRN